MKVRLRSSSGMTLMELMAAVTVLAIITIGLGLTTRTIQLNYARDTVRGEIRQYGNLVMREIVKDISLANDLTVSSMNGFSRLIITRLNEFNQPEVTTVSASMTGGISIDNEAPLNGHLQFPDGGRFRHLQSVRLTDFSVREIPVIRPSLTKFARSTYDIELEFMVQPRGEGRQKLDPEYIRFKRRIFMPMKYVVQNNAPLNPAAL
ncbi:MAG: prepilin-type N-terminal cleavage/methylation domain-containing protein [Candidatus Neomarinimicrobiota bacterium]|nr:MAG: prepilin-type N-terminal cleavage/methylation domain-containing protein [Candidatus Neomarinimicrobiota bacterium]